MEQPTTKEQGSLKPERTVPSREAVKKLNATAQPEPTEAPTQPNSDSNSNK